MVSKNPDSCVDFWYGLYTNLNSLNSETRWHSTTSTWPRFSISFLISNNLDGNTTDGNAAASVNCDPAPNVEIAESDKGVDDLIPKEIAKKVSRWLQRNNVPQKYFAEKVLYRSQGSFSDCITKAPTV